MYKYRIINDKSIFINSTVNAYNTYTNQNGRYIKKMQDRVSACLVKHGLVYKSLGFNYQEIKTLLKKAIGLAFHC